MNIEEICEKSRKRIVGDLILLTYVIVINGKSRMDIKRKTNRSNSETIIIL